MKNRNVGIILLIVALFILFLVFSYDKALDDITGSTCSMGTECSMYKAFNVQKTISYSLIGLLIAGSLYVIFFLKDRPGSGEAIKPSKKTLAKLDEDEKKVMGILSKNQGSAYQSDIMKELDFSKVKVTRVLDKLETKGIVERKRRGMTNIVVLK